MNEKFRWGILGAAQIARKNWKAIRNTTNGVVIAVASRDLERGRQFIGECQAEAPMEKAPRSLGSYQELIASNDVDGIYIPLPTGLRKEWVIRAAEAGKHVVCEKPCAITSQDLQEMVAACRRNNVQFMDGVMFMHSKRLERIRETLRQPEAIGRIRRIASGFSFRAPEEFLTGNIRMHSELEPQGCLGDLGWYCIRFALWLMEEKLPAQVTGRILSQLGRQDSPVTVPAEFSGELFFEGDVSAGFYCSFLTAHQQWVHISGTEGWLQVPDFVLPFFGNELAFEVQNASFQVHGCDFVMESHSRCIAVSEYSNSHPQAQETSLFQNFADQVQSGKLNDSWPDIALKTQIVMDACLESARNGNRLQQISSAHQ
jgi:predicted dehydrogenase